MRTLIYLAVIVVTSVAGSRSYPPSYYSSSSSYPPAYSMPDPPQTYGSEYSVPVNYEFNYGVKDYYTGQDFKHTENRQGVKTSGSYTVALPDGRLQIVTYVADENGFVADIKYEGEVQHTDKSYASTNSYQPSPIHYKSRSSYPEPSPYRYPTSHDSSPYHSKLADLEPAPYRPKVSHQNSTMEADTAQLESLPAPQSENVPLEATASEPKVSNTESTHPKLKLIYPKPVPYPTKSHPEPSLYKPKATYTKPSHYRPKSQSANPSYPSYSSYRPHPSPTRRYQPYKPRPQTYRPPTYRPASKARYSSENRYEGPLFRSVVNNLSSKSQVPVAPSEEVIEEKMAASVTEESNIASPSVEATEKTSAAKTANQVDADPVVEQIAISAETKEASAVTDQIIETLTTVEEEKTQTDSPIAVSETKMDFAAVTEPAFSLIDTTEAPVVTVDISESVAEVATVLPSNEEGVTDSQLLTKDPSPVELTVPVIADQVEVMQTEPPMAEVKEVATQFEAIVAELEVPASEPQVKDIEPKVAEISIDDPEAPSVDTEIPKAEPEIPVAATESTVLVEPEPEPVVQVITSTLAPVTHKYRSRYTVKPSRSKAGTFTPKYRSRYTVKPSRWNARVQPATVVATKETEAKPEPIVVVTTTTPAPLTTRYRSRYSVRPFKLKTTRLNAEPTTTPVPEVTNHSNYTQAPLTEKPMHSPELVVTSMYAPPSPPPGGYPSAYLSRYGASPPKPFTRKPYKFASFKN